MDSGQSSDAELAEDSDDNLYYEDDADGSDDPSYVASSEEEAEEEEEETGIDPDENLDETQTNVELQIEGDFDRLVQNIRGTDDVASTGMLSKVWDFGAGTAVDEQQDMDLDAQFQDDLRAASGIGRKRAGKKRARQAGVVLSHQVRALIGEANQAYVDDNLPETIRIMLEVIRIEPRAASAWSVLAQCHRDMNEPLKALQLGIMAAHLQHDPDEWERLAQQSRELGYNTQALYCYRKLVSLNPGNVNALWDRASLAKEVGDLKAARHAFLTILKSFPHDLAVLNELRYILIDLNELTLCADLFQRAFHHYVAAYPLGTSTTVENGQTVQTPGGGFGEMEVFVLVDLYTTLNQHERAISTLKSGCRWLQGRASQRFWDACADDREFDIEGAVVREAGSGPVEPGWYPLEINARHRLAVARLKLGEMVEGKMHASIILTQDVMDYAPLFAEIADAYFERDMFADARPIYELLGADATTSSIYILMQTAACRRMLGDLHEAAEVYEHIITGDPTNSDAKMKLAEIYEITNEPRKALELVYQVIDSRRRRQAERNNGTSTVQSNGDAAASLFPETSGKKKKSVKAQNRMTHEQLREIEDKKEREVLQQYKRVKELWPRMLRKDREAETEWLLEAEKMVEAFRETRNLFLTSKSQPFRGMFPRSKVSARSEEAEEDNMASRLHLDLEHESIARKSKGDGRKEAVSVFRGVEFDDWLVLFMEYAFLLTRRDQYPLAEEVLQHILLSNVYRDRSIQDSLRLAIITCAIHARRPNVVVEQARKLIITYQFNNEPLRLLVASVSSGLSSTDAFITSKLQKHILREIKLSDAAVKGKDLKWNPPGRRWVLSSAKSGEDHQEDDADEDGDGGGDDAPVKPTDKPTKDNPLNVAIYGQICTAAKSYQSAIFYLLHAYDYLPDDPVICLSLAIASLGRAMQRQADNRHHLITQAVAFLSRYRDLRGSDATRADEVEFNFGRAFHQLGLYSHAVQQYERVFEIAEARTKLNPDDFGVAREAAYNCALIYVLTGATWLAEDLYRRWLTI